MSVYLRARLQVSSITLMSFRGGGGGGWGGGFKNPPPPPPTHTHTSNQTPKKPTQIRVKLLTQYKIDLKHAVTPRIFFGMHLWLHKFYSPKE